MRHRLLSTILTLVACLAVSAQGTCIIKGNIADSKLSDGKKIKKVYLTCTNEFGQKIDVAEAKVKKGRYTFSHELAQGEPVLQYTITGFGDNQGIELFVEPGEVTVNTPLATQPEQSIVAGTVTNDTYAEYKAIQRDSQDDIAAQIAALEEHHGKEWLTTAEGKSMVKRIKAKENIKEQSQVFRFLIEHNASPMTPLEVERALLPKLTPAYAEQISKSIGTPLKEHPYYLSLRNMVLANSMKVGSEVPDITLPLLNGEVKHLTDYRGKYIVLNFWSSNCEKSSEMLAELKKVYEMIKKEADDPNQYVFVSFALESDKAAWENAINSNDINREGWVHACDGMGVASKAAKRFAVDTAPKMILIDPEGYAISLNLETNEVAMRMGQIVSGDLYYLDQMK